MTKTNISLTKICRTHLSAILAVTALGFVSIEHATAQVRSANGVTVLSVDNSVPQLASVDFVRAKPMSLPLNPLSTDATQSLLSALMTTQKPGAPGHVAGVEGNGTTNPTFLGTPEFAEDGVAPQDFGTNKHPFSTARADLNGLNTNRAYPYRAAGKLFFNIGSSTYMCSASLIKRGIVVTAAHCVANFGRSQFYSNWHFIPGYRNGNAPFGTHTVRQVWIKTSYFNGTDSCAVAGVVCTNDVAVLTLNPTTSGAYAGTSTGWLGYGWNGYGFVNTLTQITQIGYPAGLDSAGLMERNDSYGYTNSSQSNNTMIGSNMDGGSSGGPWVVNFGIKPTLTGETNGSAPSPNVVVGVTSWGYTSTAPKEQGASAFTSNNIVSLVNSACSAAPAACL